MRSTPQTQRTAFEMTDLLEQLRMREEDIRLSQRGGDVLYAIDNDVITDITAPWKSQHRHYLDLLFVDSQESQQAYAFIFASFVLNAGLSTPFVIVAPGENELDGMWNKVYYSAIREVEDIEDDLNRLLLNDQKQLGKGEVLEIVRELVKVIYESASALSELRRINRLTQAGAVCRMDAMLTREGEAPFAAFTEADLLELKRLESTWANALARLRPSRENSNTVDARVMARVELVNRRFVEGNILRKLCFVTGDATITRAAKALGAFGGSGQWKEYLRSPVCFLEDIDVFKSSSIGEVPDDLSAFEGIRHLRFSEWLGQLAEEHTSSIGRPKRNIAEEVDRARLQWSKYLRSASASIQLSASELEAAVDVRVAELLAQPNVHGVLETLRDQIAGLASEAVTGFSVASALARFWSLDARQAAKGGRGVPPVRFDSFKNAQELAQKLTEADGLARAQIQLDRQWIGKLREEDERNYTVLVVFSLAFAFAGEWKTAYTVSNLAFTVAANARAAGSMKVKGDEAAYLCAVFQRLSAQQPSELNECLKWLDAADSLLRLDSKRAIYNGLSDGEITDPRIEAERIAVSLARKLWGTFLPKSSFGVEVAASSLLNTRLIEVHLKQLRALEQATKNHPKHVCEYVTCQLLVNAAQICLLEKRDGVEAESWASDVNHRLRRLLARYGSHLDEQIEAYGAERKSDLVPFVLLTFFSTFESNALSQDRDQIAARLKSHASGLRHLPYDVERAREFMRLADEYS